MTPFLDRVTLTGVDESVPVEDVLTLAEQFPFAEFGVLVSAIGTRRSRRLTWLEQLASGSVHYKSRRFALHLCHSKFHPDSWLIRALQGDWNFIETLGPTWALFDRVQLNLRNHIARIRHPEFFTTLRTAVGNRQVIFQLGAFNHPLVAQSFEAEIATAVLLDLSGGRGVLPSAWTMAAHFECGYAGGLTPENLAGQLQHIGTAAEPAKSVWIDAQSAFSPWNREAAQAYFAAAERWVKPSRV